MLIAQRGVRLLSLPRWAFVPFFVAIAIYCLVSSVLSLAQALGWHPIYQWSATQFGGLFYNPTEAGAALALAGVALYAHRLGWLIPALFPGLYYAGSRGGWVALAFGLLAANFRRPLWLAILVLVGAFFLTLHPGSSDLERMEIWKAAWLNLTFWGNGFGSFIHLYMGDPACCLKHPEYAHNDYLQTIFEFGIWSMVPFGVVAFAASRTQAEAWPLLLCFLFLACFSMPLHMPIPAALGALALCSILQETLNV